jgi:ribosomal protein S18 acetylase RimI-like enzyme
MKERWREPVTMVRIRRGGTGDARFVREIAELVFAELGDYGRILPTWLMHDGVLTHVAEDDGVPVGYTMLGFYSAPPPRQHEYVADLLAIAVAPSAQGRGVGKQLLDHAIGQASLARRRLPVTELRLSVAEPNARARALFQQFGFRFVDGEHGRYDGGQRALHMARLVDK